MMMRGPVRASSLDIRSPGMADDKTKSGAQDRRTVAGGEKYEVDYEAKKLGVTPAEIRKSKKK